MLILILCAAAVLGLGDPPREPATGANGGTQPAARKKLALGDPAPPLSVDYWSKGEELAEFEAGKTYVIEFWATWSSPCKKVIPLLNDLSKKYPDIRIVGVAAGEKPPEKDKEDFRLSTVNGFVRERGDGIAYSIAFDGDETMNLTWMEPANQSGMPMTFIVDGKGRIAWIGSPNNGLEDVLAKIAAGKYDIEKVKLAMALKVEANGHLEHEKYEEAIILLDRSYMLDPGNTGALVLKFNTILLKIKARERASTFANECLEGPLKNDAGALEQIMRTIITAPGLDSRDFPLAVKLGERAVELAPAPNAKTLEILAKAYRGAGNKAKSVATLEKAVAASEGTMQQVLNDTLEAWKKDASK